MSVESFISSRIRFGSRLATFATAFSFLVVVIAIAVCSGFRHEIISIAADQYGDILLAPPENYSDTALHTPVPAGISYLDSIRAIDGIKEVRGVVRLTGIVRAGDVFEGVEFKGLEQSGLQPMKAEIPSDLASRLRLGDGDRMLAYFLAGKLKARRFKAVSSGAPSLGTGREFVVRANADDLRRVLGWADGQVSEFEIILDEKYRNEYDMQAVAFAAGATAMDSALPDEPVLIPQTLSYRFPEVFGWMDLIDNNVSLILILMIMVAGFNMVSGLLILLFHSTGTIGLLKALGMKGRDIGRVFLRVGTRVTGTGLLAGNAAAIALIAVQMRFHVIPLNAANYFVSFVPVHLNWGMIATLDLAAFVAVNLILLLPCLFISHIDPASTLRTE